MSRALSDELRPDTEVSTGAPEKMKPISPIQLNLSPSMEQMMVEVVLDDFEKARSDRNQRDYGTTSKGEKLKFDKWIKNIKDLYNGERIPKDLPWRFCSNRSLRIATSILDMIHARLFPAVWNEDLTRWRSMNVADYPKVDRITRFMDWWIRVWAPLRPFYDKWVKLTAGYGDSLTETSYEVYEMTTNDFIEDPILDENGQPVSNQDGTPAVMKTMKPKRIEKTKSRVIPKENYFLMKGSTDIEKDPVCIEEEYLFKELEDLEKRGFCKNITKELAKHIIVSIPINSDMTPEEKERIRLVKMRNVPVKIVRWYGHYDIDGVGINESIRVYVSPEHKVYLGGVRMRDVTKSGLRPLDHTKYDSYIDRPDDLDGEGLLHKCRELSDEIDAIFNQMTDAHTLAVLRPFFYDPSGDVDAPAIEMGPNRGIPVSDPSRNIYYPPFEIPTERLINAIRLVMEFVERLTAGSEYIMGRESGTVGGSGTATRTQAIVQSAEIRFTLPSERLRAGAARILQQHLDILQLNIPPGLENMVVGEKGERVFHAGELTDEGIAGQFAAYLLPDPSMGSKQQERDMWNQIYSVLMINPLVATDPKKIYSVTAQNLKVMGIRDYEKYIGPEVEMDDITNPEDENSLMIRGQFDKVTPMLAENHLHHVQKHMDLEKSPALKAIAQTAPELTQQILEYNRLHIQQHMQMMQNLVAINQKGNPNGGQPEGSEDGTNPVGVGEEGAQNSSPGSNMENTPGPLGKALDQKRKGESGGNPVA
jgi:hypothetical protein